MVYDAIIIGAGLGGLSAGAYLSRAGKNVLVLEKMNEPGGRCRSVQMMGHRFDIGADYFGKKILGTMRELGKEKEVEPVWFKVISDTDGKTMTVPPGLHTIKELRRMGMSLGDITGFGWRMGRQLAFKSYRSIPNNLELVNKITRNSRLREVLNIGAFFSGNDPENMPSYWFNLVFGKTYGYDKPFFPRGGSGRIPELLADVIRESGGGIVYNASPKKIIVKDGKAAGVVLDGREIESAAVISGVGILPTVHSLVGKEHFPYGFLNTIGYYKEGLSMASIFVVFRRSAKITKGVHVYARFSRNMSAMFRVLKEGRFPEKGMFILSCPDAADDPGTEHLAGTIKFLIPRGGAEREAIEAEAQKIIGEVDQVVPGFKAAVVDSRLYAPRDYVDNFGFVSTVTPVAESVHYEKLGVETPLPGLYCAGSTVLPAGGCAVSSIESGKAAAKLVIKRSGN
ncbi:MAG: FAD-dependent oxidoreductase [Nitrospirota bacterium]